jgi:hypothetical protein
MVSTIEEREQRTDQNAIGMVHKIITTMNTLCKFEMMTFTVPSELIPSKTFHHRVKTQR